MISPITNQIELYSDGSLNIGEFNGNYVLLCVRACVRRRYRLRSRGFTNNVKFPLKTGVSLHWLLKLNAPWLSGTARTRHPLNMCHR